MHKSDARSGQLSPILVAALLAVTATAIAYYFPRVWTVDDLGLSVVTGKVPSWDFSNMWGGSKLALEGRVEALFDFDLYHRLMTELLEAPAYAQAWSYPPTTLLLGAPFALLPLNVAFWVWTVLTVAAMALSLSTLPLPRAALLLAVASPAIVMNALFGQNGALTAALVIGGLSFAERRPVLGGVLIGLMCVKPHLALLTPFALIASGNWRAVFAAAATVLAAGLAATLAFGTEQWILFFEKTRPMMTALLTPEFGQTGNQINSISVFMLARSLHAGLGPAYALQGLAAVIAIALTIRLWRRPDANRLARIMTTALLTILATPYEWSYDLALISGPLAWLITTDPRARWVAITAWIWPAITHLVTMTAGIPVAPILLAAAAMHSYRLAMAGSDQTATTSSADTAPRERLA